VAGSATGHAPTASRATAPDTFGCHRCRRKTAHRNGQKEQATKPWYWRTRAGDSVTVDIMQTTYDDQSRVLVTLKVVQTALAEDGFAPS
jgi:hypothetical protein